MAKHLCRPSAKRYIAVEKTTETHDHSDRAQPGLSAANRGLRQIKSEGLRSHQRRQWPRPSVQPSMIPGAFALRSGLAPRVGPRVGPWVGPRFVLAPSRNPSGERDVSGGLTKAGDVNLRRALCQAATPFGRFAVQIACRAVVMMTRGTSTWLRTWGARLAQRRGRQIAMVALARRIAVILHGIGRDGPTFRPDAAPGVA